MAWVLNDIAPLPLGQEFDPPASPWAVVWWGPPGLAFQAGGAAFTSTATWEQAPASWAATATETFASTATYVQAAATWAAVAAEAFSATGSFTQAAAAWDAVVAETFASTGTWAQAAATWDALAAVTGGGAHDFTGAWDQAAASWASEVAVPTPPVTDMGGWSRVRQTFAADPEPIYLTARFHQAPATWRADMTNDDDDIALGLTEDALLVLV